MATLVHDDLLDGADLRRGRPTVWAAYGEGAAKAVGDYLFARAFARARGHRRRGRRARPRRGGARARPGRGAAAPAGLPARTRPSRTICARCSLKTGKLFEAACVIGGRPDGLGAFGLSLGVAFQIADDILDCTGEFDTTGKAAGVDLRDGTPTLPLILAAREDAEVRRALAGEQVDDALDRVAATGALDRSRSIALEYARRARAALDGEPDRASLEALTYAVVDREALIDGDRASARSTRSATRWRRTSGSTSRTGSRSWSPTTSCGSASSPISPAGCAAAPTTSTSSRTCT